MRLRERKIAIVISSFIIILLFLSFHAAETSRHAPQTSSSLLTNRKTAIAEAFQHAWDGYSHYCFGNDTLNPVSNTCEDDFGGMGVTAIDALSTAIILEKDDVVVQILDFIASLDFSTIKVGTKYQVFEVAIRHFAGMISAWDLLHGPFDHLAKDKKLRKSLYNAMVTLGDVMSCAFRTPSGIPRDWVDPTTCELEQEGRNSIAAAGTMILEMARLSDITGNKTYAELAERAEAHLLDPHPADKGPGPGLLGSFVSIDTGFLSDSSGSWGAMADSYYEYLLKAYLYNSNVYGPYLESWKAAADSTIRFVASSPYGHPELTFLPSWSGVLLDHRMESLSWFAGGSFILGGVTTNNKTLVDFGLSLADTAGVLYNMTKTGLGPEFVEWKVKCKSEDDNCDPDASLSISNPKFRLRPEVLETWYHAYRATRDPKYREWSWSAFEAINKYCRTSSGFSAISDVNSHDGGAKLDKQESFVFAEVMKYIYLTHLEDKRATFHVQDSRTGVKNTWVFNTEAHPFRVAGPPK
ncbi:hypothetical protein AMS68_002597 [Peltaster fructicola]|uniref:alpha-1,2-Mannosidase n=1 Tax=Peltaster fructicola TaxID=286661 RepID=A0A6H0XRI4_9PEZI|nr:hypothetical protein AMS68_002597 [Peltaster fructicola]